ncbi:hypothetical protein U1Q18_027001 [Sarracenia purpurea var. burkii]
METAVADVGTSRSGNKSADNLQTAITEFSTDNGICGPAICDEHDVEIEIDSGKYWGVQDSDRSGRTGFSRGKILVVADVFDGGEGEGETLGELDPTNDGEGDEPVEEGHEAGGTEEEEDGGGGYSGGHDLGNGEVGGFRDGHGGDGLHGLNRHGDAEEKTGGDVVERREDEGGAEIEVRDEGEGQDYGDVSAEITDGASEFGPDGGLDTKAGGTRKAEEAVAPPLPAEERGGVAWWFVFHVPD